MGEEEDMGSMGDARCLWRTTNRRKEFGHSKSIRRERIRKSLSCALRSLKILAMDARVNRSCSSSSETRITNINRVANFTMVYNWAWCGVPLSSGLARRGHLQMPHSEIEARGGVIRSGMLGVHQGNLRHLHIGGRRDKRAKS